MKVSIYLNRRVFVMWPALVAQLDGHLTGDQEVVGLTLSGSATFFHGD